MLTENGGSSRRDKMFMEGSVNPFTLSFAFLLLDGRLGIMRHFVEVELATVVWHRESNRLLG